MENVKLEPLPPELQALQERWLALSGKRKEQDEFYAKEFAEPFARVFARRPLVGAPEDLPQPHALVSLLGFSWQPVALMAAWCKPERMLVIGTRESLSLEPAGEEVLTLIARVAGIRRPSIESVCVDDPGEIEIYRHVRDFLEKSQIPPRRVFVDPTGGKKSMSSAAALAAFLLGAPLVYVDYGQYHGSNRIPVAGTEYPRLLANPLEVLGDLERREIFRAFNRADFQTAEYLAGRLAERLYEPREAECLEALARGYGLWDAFRFKEAMDELEKAKNLLDRFADRGAWRWASVVRQTLERNLQALDALTQIKEKPSHLEEGIPLLAWYLAGAERMLDIGKASVAVLLMYAAVERYIGLCLWVEHGLDLDAKKPDYGPVLEKLNREAYHAAGRLLFGQDYELRDPSGPIMFANGVQLLLALSPDRLGKDDVGRLKGLAECRNRCEFEHGFLPKPPRVEDARRYLVYAREIIARATDEVGVLEKACENCRFPKLEVE